jgi:hypothetical protein
MYVGPRAFGQMPGHHFLPKKQQNFNVSLPSLLFIEIQEFLGYKS